MASSAKAHPAEFASRLQAVRAANAEHPTISATAYINGQISEGDQVSDWDNFDRYYKFYNISPE
jgi:hypothetical protein